MFKCCTLETGPDKKPTKRKEMLLECSVRRTDVLLHDLYSCVSMDAENQLASWLKLTVKLAECFIRTRGLWRTLTQKTRQIYQEHRRLPQISYFKTFQTARITFTLPSHNAAAAKLILLNSVSILMDSWRFRPKTREQQHTAVMYLVWALLLILHCTN